MKAKLLLAEAATGHPDGTISILRAGLTHVWSENAPIPFQGVLVARIEGDLGDAGASHLFDLRCMDADGKDIGPPVKGQFIVPQGGGVQNLILGMSVGFPKHGTYTFVLRVDNVQRDDWKLEAKKPPTPSGENP